MYKNSLFSSNFHRVTENLYISDYIGAYNISFLKSNKITHILVCARELPCRFPGSFEYLHLDLDDTAKSDLSKHIIPSLDFIKTGLGDGGRILVHCSMGVSRSSSIIISYLIQYKGFTYKNALNLLKNKHPEAQPSSAFEKQLIKFEKKLKEKIKPSCLCSIF
jgi:protein-tyrosine phosphatase